MSIILPNSVFYHIGRTGGHWVNHVLWAAGLIEQRLFPLHLTPAQVASNPLVATKRYSFCFVRHPLRWAASLWRHQMEFGWSGSEMSNSAAQDNFAEFLQNLLQIYPNGACRSAMTPYTNNCTFVGRLETIADDLKQALTEAGETFDAHAFQSPPVNETSVQVLKSASVAPIEVLEAFMKAEQEFCSHFGYNFIPQEMIGTTDWQPWPKLPVRKDSNGVPRLSSPMLVSTKTRFIYHLDDGQILPSNKNEKRMQWSIMNVVDEWDGPGRCAVVSETDPYPAYLLATKPNAKVTFVAADKRAVSQRLTDHLQGPLDILDFRDFIGAEYEELFDFIFLVDSADINAILEGELIAMFKRLKPGGVLVAILPILQIEPPIRITLPLKFSIRFGQKLVYQSLSQWEIVFANCGFGEFEVVDRFNEAPEGDDFRNFINQLASSLQVDAGHFLGKAVIRVRRTGEASMDVPISDLREQWMKRSLFDLTDTAYDFLPPVIEARLLAAEDEARKERLRRDRAEQGIADREQELLAARRNIYALASDADYSREQLIRARKAQEEAQIELDQLRNLLRQLHVTWPIGTDENR
jgi:hypothetical protein